jgi:hypothetical protein
MIYQCYYPAPYRDFLTWIDVVDPTNYNFLRIFTTRTQIDVWDPQRAISYIPTDIVPIGNDLNPDSDTKGFQMFELWGQPLSIYSYQCYGIRRGVALEEDEDELPEAVGEDVVIEGAKIKAYEWAEANKGDMPRNAGADFRFLIGNAKAEFKRLYTDYRRDDRERIDNWLTVRRLTNVLSNVDGMFNAAANTANPGAPW